MVENELDKVDKIKIRRSCIPSKDNPPEEMMEWLKTFTVCKILVLVKYVYHKLLVVIVKFYNLFIEMVKCRKNVSDRYASG